MKKIGKILFLISLFIPILFSLSAFGNNISNIDINNEKISSCKNLEIAEVKYIVDGDTVHLSTGGEIIKTRLFGIDCMETSKIYRAYKQAYENNLDIDKVIEQGISATNELKTIIRKSDNRVYFKTMAVDKYNRLVAILYDKNLNSINDTMAKSGYCPVYEFKNKNH